MAKVVFSLVSAKQLEKIRLFYLSRDESLSIEVVKTILRFCRRVSKQPLAGRPVENELRELLIPFGKQGFIALYKLDVSMKRIVILALRHQRESGF